MDFAVSSLLFRTNVMHIHKFPLCWFLKKHKKAAIGPVMIAKSKFKTKYSITSNLQMEELIAIFQNHIFSLYKKMKRVHSKGLLQPASK